MPKLPDQTKECGKHGVTRFVHEPSKPGKGYRCRLCRIEHVTRKRQELKKALIAHLGGKCGICGYSRCPDALQFHHRPETTKEAAVSSLIGAYRSKKAWAEANKCVLLCANCHAEEHYAMHRRGIEPPSSGLQPDA